jgi:hypothetical protein
VEVTNPALSVDWMSSFRRDSLSMPFCWWKLNSSSSPSEIVAPFFVFFLSSFKLTTCGENGHPQKYNLFPHRCHMHCQSRCTNPPPPPTRGNVLVDWSPASVGSQLKGQWVVQINQYNTGMSLSNKTYEFVIITT